MYLLMGFRQSTPPQDRQGNISIGDGKQQLDNLVGELTFQNQAPSTFCEAIIVGHYDGLHADSLGSSTRTPKRTSSQF
jgi:hypothetical protein